jgi:hypothetical protein
MPAYSGAIFTGLKIGGLFATPTPATPPALADVSTLAYEPGGSPAAGGGTSSPPTISQRLAIGFDATEQQRRR